MGLSLLRTRIAPGGVIDDGEGTIAQLAQARGSPGVEHSVESGGELQITNSWIAINIQRLNGG